MLPRHQKPDACSGCPLHAIGFGYAPAEGPAYARLSFYAEALGGDEAMIGKPLQGAAGGVHTRILHRAGITREHTRADNCLRCSPPGNWLDGAPWEYGALAHCHQAYGVHYLNSVPDNGVLVTYGGTALRQVLNLHGVEGIGVKEFHGTVNRDPSDRFWVVPTFHPSHLQRGAMNLLEVVTSDLRLADRVGAKGFLRSACQLVVDPTREWFAHWVDQHLAKVAADPDGTHLSLDTEFPESITGQDESELALTSQSRILRVNGANDGLTGWTVKYEGTMIQEIERLLAGVNARQGLCWLWNKYADWNLLQHAGHSIQDIIAYDGMWAWKYLQSDLPRGLGFVAPLASDMGPWKHWGKVKEKEGPYAAADGVQTWRTCMWILKELHRSHLWQVFERDWHERDVYVLRPSHELGVPVDRARLEAFHVDLQAKATRILGDVKNVGAEGTLRPKQGYTKKPKPITCTGCDGSGRLGETSCTWCGGTGQVYQPPKSLTGANKGGKKKSEAKEAYVAEGIVLVERTVGMGVRVCRSCGKAEVGPKHNCLRRKKAAKKDDGGVDQPPAIPVLTTETRSVQRWFWQLPFNPSSWQQILAYIGRAGHEPGTSKKTRKPTTDAASLKQLAATTGDPLYQLLLDLRAVEKVDGTYALGTLNRLDADSRVHPEYLPIPSTLRDSARNPNLTNVVADKDSSKNLAAGFRACIVARDGIPPGTTEEEVQQWHTRWNIATTTATPSGPSSST